MLSDLRQDLQYAVRSLLRAPALAGTIVATLSLGIGANTLIFTAVNAVLLRGMPVFEPDRLVDVYTASNTNLYGNSSYPDYFDLRDSGTFPSLAAFAQLALTLDVNGEAEPIAGQLVTGNYFGVLGIRMARGREFIPDEDRIGAPMHVAVVSDKLWRRALAADPSVIGRPIRLNNNQYTIIGVAPAGFSGSLIGVGADIWVPAALQPELDPASPAVRRARGHAGKFDLRGSRGLNIVGRLPAGAVLAATAAQLDVVSRRLQSAHADTNGNRRFEVVSLGEGRGLRASTRPTLRLLTAIVSLVLAVACINVASLLLVRATSREREVAVRLAIGASRARLIRQWLTESALLGSLGAVGALAFARAGTPLLHRFVIPDVVDLSLDRRVFGFTLVAGLASGLLFGIAPVVQALQRTTAGVLRERTTSGTSRRGAWLRDAFVVAQIAVSLVLAVGAGLFLRTLDNAYAVDLGYRIDDVVVTTVNLETRGYSPEAGAAVYDRILSRLNAQPGVLAASAARMTILSGSARSTVVSTNGLPIAHDGANALGVRENIISPRYFETMGIPVMRGRGFDASDGSNAPRVAVVTQSFADRLWPQQDPIGRTVRDEGAHELTIVGVVPDTVYTSTLDVEKPPTYYVPLAQDYQPGVTLHVRAARDPMSLVPVIREAVRAVDSQLAIERPRLLRDVLDETLSRQRMMATSVGLFGGVTLVLAVLGLYGVMAHVATERTHEIGVRLAMGARPASIVTLLLAQGLRLFGIGLALGLAGAWFGARYIQSQLFGVTPTDPLTFTAGGTILAVACLAACAIPAVRAMRVDPMTVFRRA
jgi:putative ABC transport system permease protein